LLDCIVLARTPVSFAVFASGSGSNFEALVHASRAPGFPGSIDLLACDVAEAPALERARRLGVAAIVPPVGRFRTRIEDERPWLEVLAARGIGAVLLAGFMRRLHAALLGAFPERILNVHPSLLPAFPGLAAIEQAFAHGVRVTGCTVHVVDDSVDAGPVVGQAAVEVCDGDTLASLAERIHAAEHRLYPECVRRYFGGPHRREGRRLVFAEEIPHA
jgi:phosphoribosylglycinamide formyltransferase-1